MSRLCGIKSKKAQKAQTFVQQPIEASRSIPAPQNFDQSCILIIKSCSESFR
jgi:hypothetical protein